MATKTAAPNLFATAAAEKKPAAAGTKEKQKIFVTGYEADLLRKAEIKAALSNLKAEDEMISGRIKEVAREKYLSTYQTQKSRPDSFHLCDGKGKVMVIVMDAYKMVTEAREAALQAYPDVIETTTTYTLNKELVEQYGQQISNAIFKSKEIPDDVKLDLVKPEATKSIKKGTIDRLLQYDNPEQLFYLIEPTVALK